MYWLSLIHISYFVAKLFRLSSLTVKKCLVLVFLSKLLIAELIRTMADFMPPLFLTNTLRPVSYTHLDVYKRQVLHRYKLYIINTIEIGLDNYNYMNTRHNSISDKYNNVVIQM